jgi:hypothetical protein
LASHVDRRPVAADFSSHFQAGMNRPCAVEEVCYAGDL